MEDHAQTAEDIGNMRSEMERLLKRNQLLEYKMKKIEREEHNLSKKVDLDDKLALKKLVVMLKMKNDQFKSRGPVARQGGVDNDDMVTNLVEKVNKLNEEKEDLER